MLNWRVNYLNGHFAAAHVAQQAEAQKRRDVVGLVLRNVRGDNHLDCGHQCGGALAPHMCADDLGHFGLGTRALDQGFKRGRDGVGRDKHETGKRGA